jgi:uncharacterized protein (TIGR02246 family)
MVRVSIPKFRFLIVAVVLGGVAFQAACGIPVRHRVKKTSPRQTVESLEEQWRQAQLNGDAAAMDKLLSDDFVGITAFGKVTTKAQQLARIRDRVVELTQLDLSDIKVKLIGPIVAVVTSRAEITGVNEGTPLKGTFRYTRVYHRVNGAWKITSFEATRADSAPAAGAQ